MESISSIRRNQFSISDSSENKSDNASTVTHPRVNSQVLKLDIPKNSVHSIATRILSLHEPNINNDGEPEKYEIDNHTILVFEKKRKQPERSARDQTGSRIEAQKLQKTEFETEDKSENLGSDQLLKTENEKAQVIAEKNESTDGSGFNEERELKNLQELFFKKADFNAVIKKVSQLSKSNESFVKIDKVRDIYNAATDWIKIFEHAREMKEKGNFKLANAALNQILKAWPSREDAIELQKEVSALLESKKIDNTKKTKWKISKTTK